MLNEFLAQKSMMTMHKLGIFLIGTILLTMVASPALSSIDLDGALQLAQGAADAWDPTNELVGIMGAWIEEAGVLHEPEDSPGWGFLYINGAGDKRVNIGVYTGCVGLPMRHHAQLALWY